MKSDLDEAYAKTLLKRISEIFNISENKIKVSEKYYPEEEEFDIHANFQHEDREWNSWAIVQRKKLNNYDNRRSFKKKFIRI